jgi:hypothetical protein
MDAAAVEVGGFGFPSYEEQLGCSLTGRATDFDSVGHVPCVGSNPTTLANNLLVG